MFQWCSGNVPEWDHYTKIDNQISLNIIIFLLNCGKTESMFICLQDVSDKEIRASIEVCLLNVNKCV